MKLISDWFLLVLSIRLIQCFIQYWYVTGRPSRHPMFWYGSEHGAFLPALEPWICAQHVLLHCDNLMLISGAERKSGYLPVTSPTQNFTRKERFNPSTGRMPVESSYDNGMNRPFQNKQRLLCIQKADSARSITKIRSPSFITWKSRSTPGDVSWNRNILPRI